MTDITLEQRAAHVATLGEMFQQCANDRRMIEADALAAAIAALRLSAGADWQPIETAPDGEPVVVFWRELQDPYDTARYGLDVLEDGVWNHHEECHQHFLSVAPPGSHGPSEAAPYTHWMRLGTPEAAAPRHETGDG